MIEHKEPRMSSLETLFALHLETLMNQLAPILAKAPRYQGLLIGSGEEHCYFGDDNHLPFQAFGHFLRWLPVNRPEQFIYLSPGDKPRYYQIIPPDFWYDQHVENASWWAKHVEIVRLSSKDQLRTHLQSLKNAAFIGEDEGWIKENSPLDVNPPSICHALDYQRAYKTDYEIQSIRDANALALRCHQTAYHCFLEGHSEFAIHLAYLKEAGQLEHELPYTNIVAMNDKSAILHYQYKRHALSDPALSLLVDAGARTRHYAADLTRTWSSPLAPEVFTHLIRSVDHIQQSLVQEVCPGRPYQDLQELAHQKVVQALLEVGILRGSEDQLMALGASFPFFPHGIGHLLGLQTHDIGGRLANDRGDIQPPPEQHPFLRLTRTMEPRMVFTIEPGIYFIPMLLEPLRDQPLGRVIHWPLIDTLYPCGGIRIEDNILVTEEGVENLTR
jgi:Xaa-Pro dipeptidase